MKHGCCIGKSNAVFPEIGSRLSLILFQPPQPRICTLVHTVNRLLSRLVVAMPAPRRQVVGEQCKNAFSDYTER